MIKYIKSVLWRVAKRLSYTEDARCLKVKPDLRLELRDRSVFDWPTGLPRSIGKVKIKYLCTPQRHTGA